MNPRECIASGKGLMLTEKLDMIQRRYPDLVGGWSLGLGPEMYS